VLLVASLTGCGPNGGEEGSRTRSGSADIRRTIEICVDRLLSRSPTVEQSDAETRRYVEEAYCERFAKSGWVYEDGALSIAAYEWLLRSGTCEVGSEGEPTRTVPCEEAAPRQAL
jgi:hypothetical protein